MAAIFERVADQHGGDGKQAEGGQCVHPDYLAVRPPVEAATFISMAGPSPPAVNVPAWRRKGGSRHCLARAGDEQFVANLGAL